MQQSLVRIPEDLVLSECWALALKPAFLYLPPPHDFPHSPQADASTCVASALIRPMKTPFPSVRMLNASSAMLKPFEPTSMASTLMDVPLAVSSQHVPQAGELNPVTAGAPPMKGKLGSDPNVVKPARHRGTKFSWFKGGLEMTLTLGEQSVRAVRARDYVERVRCVVVGLVKGHRHSRSESGGDSQECSSERSELHDG